MNRGPDKLPLGRQKARLGYLFVAPAVFGLLVFTIGPVVASFVLSTFDWNGLTPPTFVGGSNYGDLITGEVLRSFVNTGLVLVASVVIQVSVALVLAVAVQRRMSRILRSIYRTAFFLPLLTSGAVISIVMAYLFDENAGLVNYYLGQIDVGPVPWLTSSDWSLITVVLAFSWHQLGFSFIIFLGGLTAMPHELLDAADVDGANALRKLWNVIVPLVSPTILFVSVITAIQAVQIFDYPYVMTRGGPGDSSRTVVMGIYESAFQDLRIGQGAALAVLLFIVILGITGLQFLGSRKWVHYQ